MDVLGFVYAVAEELALGATREPFKSMILLLFRFLHVGCSAGARGPRKAAGSPSAR